MGENDKYNKAKKSRHGGKKSRKAQRQENLIKAREVLAAVRGPNPVIQRVLHNDHIDIRDANSVNLDDVYNYVNIDVDNTSDNGNIRSSDVREPSPKRTRRMSQRASVPPPLSCMIYDSSSRALTSSEVSSPRDVERNLGASTSTGITRNSPGNRTIRTISDVINETGDVNAEETFPYDKDLLDTREVMGLRHKFRVHSKNFLPVYNILEDSGVLSTDQFVHIFIVILFILL